LAKERQDNTFNNQYSVSNQNFPTESSKENFTDNRPNRREPSVSSGRLGMEIREVDGKIRDVDEDIGALKQQLARLERQVCCFFEIFCLLIHFLQHRERI